MDTLSSVTQFPSSLMLSEPLQQLKTLIATIGHIKKVPVENDQMDTIWDISADEVEKKGEICYMNPCIAQTLYTIKKLKEGYPAEDIALGVEFLTYANERKSFHFFIEIQHNNDIYIIDFSHDKYAFFYKGPFKNRNQKHTLTSDTIIMVPARDIQNSDNIFTIAEKQGMDAQALKKLLSTHLQHLKKDNTPKEWERFNATKNGPLEIIDGTIDFSDIAFYVNDGLYSTLLSNDTTALGDNFETYKLEIHALLLQPPTEKNQQQLYTYLTNAPLSQ